MRILPNEVNELQKRLFEVTEDYLERVENSSLIQRIVTSIKNIIFWRDADPDCVRAENIQRIIIKANSLACPEKLKILLLLVHGISFSNSALKSDRMFNILCSIDFTRRGIVKIFFNRVWKVHELLRAVTIPYVGYDKLNWQAIDKLLTTPPSQSPVNGALTVMGIWKHNRQSLPGQLPRDIVKIIAKICRTNQLTELEKAAYTL